MALWSQMFPSQFEKAYNLPREYVYTPISTKPKPEIRDPFRRKQQDIADEQGLMRSAQFKHRQYHSLTVPEITGRRPHANLTQGIYGGDLQTDEGQKLGREITRRRAKNYEELARSQPYTPLPATTPAFTPFNVIDTELSNAIASVSYGDISSKATDSLQKVLTSLLAQGNELSADELLVLHEKLGDAVDLNALRNLDEDQDAINESYEQQRLRRLFQLYFDTLNRTLLFLIKYAENSPRERSLQQKSLRKEVSGYFRKREKEVADPLRREARFGTRERATPRMPVEPFSRVRQQQVPAGSVEEMIGTTEGEGRLRRLLR